MTLAPLASAQNVDGGWGYRGGGSWVEPTAYALLGLLAENAAPRSVDRGLDWLKKLQRPDGGWPPRAEVLESVWVTALVSMLGPERLGEDCHRRATGWLLRQTGAESTLVSRLRQWMLGASSSPRMGPAGWSWYPGTSAWLTPTALTVLALRQASKERPNPEIQRRIDSGREFIWSRVCADGGWNHGSSRALGYDGASYPETTGVALLSLAGTTSPKLPRAIDAARRHADACRSTEGLVWLQLGLLAHSGLSRELVTDELPCHTILDRALVALARAATRGRNLLLE